jgi:polyhydroxybutyrate depolymerase
MRYGITVAGSKDSLPGQDSAHLFKPVCVFVTANGDIYVSDYGNNRVQKWARGATYGVTVAGNSACLGGSDSAHLQYPWGIWVDKSYAVYVSDYYNHRVQKWLRNAHFGITVAGSKVGKKGKDSGHLNLPTGLWISDSGIVYIADFLNNRIQKWAPGVNYGTTVAGDKYGVAGFDSAHVTYPIALWLDSLKNIFIADYGNRIVKWSQSKKVGYPVIGLNAKAGHCDSTGITGPAGITMDHKRNIYVSENNSNRISKWILGGISHTCFMKYDTIWRHYIVHLPRGYIKTGKYAMVINFHGYGDSAADQEMYTQMDVTADSFGFIVLYPDAVNHHWNIGLNGYKYHSSPDDVGFISALIDSLTTKYAVDKRKVYACGWSDGGYFSYRVGCELSRKVAAVASVSGLMTDSMQKYCMAGCALPVMHFHGTSDPEVNYNGSKSGHLSADSVVYFWRQHNSCAGTTNTLAIPVIDTADSCHVVKYTYNGCRDSAIVVFYKILGGGHTWPGAGFKVAYLGHTSHDINANNEMWHFFSKHILTCGTSNNIGSEALSQGIASLSCFPNPFGDYLQCIQRQGLGPISLVQITDILGQVVWQTDKIESNQFKAQTGDLRAGVYIMHLQMGLQKMTYKLIKAN